MEVGLRRRGAWGSEGCGGESSEGDGDDSEEPHFLLLDWMKYLGLNELKRAFGVDSLKEIQG